MKRSAIFLAFIFSAIIIQERTAAQQASVSFQIFYDQLSPYGQWVDYPKYGYVWIPDAGADFVPYSSRGHWVLTEYGWAWVSDYKWGWAPFHYGRWDYDDSYGWLWVPDNEWGPSWVTWRHAEGYYGWAPMEPGISISLSFGRGYDNHHDHWRFVRDRDFERTDLNRYYVKRGDRDRIIGNSTVINKTYEDRKRHTTYVAGPAREDIQKVTGRKIAPVSIQDNAKPGQNLRNGQLQIYRPEVKRNGDKEQKPAPTKIVNLKDVKRPPERNAKTPSGNTKQQINNNGQPPAAIRPQVNRNNTVNPAQPKIVNPTGNNRQNRPPAAVNPQINKNNNVKPSQPQKVNPTGNNRQSRQPAVVNPQGTKNNNARPAQPRAVNPSGNKKQIQQQRTSKPQNNRPQPPPQRTVTPQNNTRPQPQRVAPPANTNRATPPPQPQRVAPPGGGNEQRPNTTTQPNNPRNDQPKESPSGQDKKR